MNNRKTLYDEYGVMFDAEKLLREKIPLKVKFLEALAEFEDNECHRSRKFPKTKPHKITGYTEPVYRAYIDKTSGWRIHAMYTGGSLHLKYVIPGQDHDNTLDVINAKEYRYKKPITSKTIKNTKKGKKK